MNKATAPRRIAKPTATVRDVPAARAYTGDSIAQGFAERMAEDKVKVPRQLDDAVTQMEELAWRLTELRRRLEDRLEPVLDSSLAEKGQSAEPVPKFHTYAARLRQAAGDITGELDTLDIMMERLHV